ncbi:MAG: hypothetical protein WD278_15775 [Pirellulales bacterium]
MRSHMERTRRRLEELDAHRRSSAANGDALDHGPSIELTSAFGDGPLRTFLNTED